MSTAGWLVAIGVTMVALAVVLGMVAFRRPTIGPRNWINTCLAALFVVLLVVVGASLVIAGVVVLVAF